MDPVYTLVVIVALAALIGWWVLRRRRPMPEEDEWRLPPEESTGAGPAAPLPAQRFDRDALVNRSRAFDPTRWDDTPDPAGDDAESEDPEDAVAEEEVEDLPRFFDRDYLRRREAGADAASATEGEAEAPDPDAADEPEPRQP